MTLAIIFMIGRIVFGLYWLQIAYNHLFHSASLIGYAQSKGVKAAKTAVVGSGIMALLGGISIILGVWPRVGIALLVIFLLGVTFRMHTYWKESNPQSKMSDKIQFEKNVAILAALLMLFTMALPWVWSV